MITLKERYTYGIDDKWYDKQQNREISLEYLVSKLLDTVDKQQQEIAQLKNSTAKALKTCNCQNCGAIDTKGHTICIDCAINDPDSFAHIERLNPKQREIAVYYLAKALNTRHTKEAKDTQQAILELSSQTVNVNGKLIHKSMTR
jgi:hypothetical protein